MCVGVREERGCVYVQEVVGEVGVGWCVCLGQVLGWVAAVR
jgi:hypothetical protein